MKLVVRGDDVGYSEVCNIGSFEAIERGIVTSADIMLDTPGSVDALERLKNYPWISIGWHCHFWGSPILDQEQVPSLYDEKRHGFRQDLSAPDINHEEALSECRAEMERCVRILGKAPDVGGSFTPIDTPFGSAVQQVHDEYHIVTDFMGMDLGMSDFSSKELAGSKIPAQNEKFKERKIFMRGLMEYCKPLKAEPHTSVGWTDSITAIMDYDPIRFYLQDESHLLSVPEDEITVHAWHPGYVDYYVYHCGDSSPQAYCFKDIRTVDVHALCSPEVRKWIRENHIELINMRDALYGTNEYQNHLHVIGSDLAI